MRDFEQRAADKSWSFMGAFNGLQNDQETKLPGSFLRENEKLVFVHDKMEAGFGFGIEPTRKYGQESLF